MKTYIVLPLLCLMACVATKKTDQNQINSEHSVNAGAANLSASKYYYSKHFDEMVKYSLDHGFNVNDQFGEEDSYVIIKSASNLAFSGDSIIKQKMFNFLHDLAYSDNNYEVNESITILIDFYIGLIDNKDLFNTSIEFLNPKHLYKEENIDADYGTDYTRILFSKLQKTMTIEDRQFYNSKVIDLYANAIENNVQDIPKKVWGEFYPYLKDELDSNKIQFHIN